MSKYPFAPVEFLAKYGDNSNMDEMKNDLDQAIAAAVLQEREACADMALMSTDTRANLAAAIRARNGTGRE